jgi:hypothetical protein
MDWSNEEYVRMYTRETADDLELSWEALALWRAMLCKFDRSGVIPVRNGWPSVARMVRMPEDVVGRAGPELVTDGRVRVTKQGFVAPNFTEAQTTSKSDKLRQQESRDRRRSVAMFKVPEIIDTGHAESRAVTERDQESRDVTLPLLPLLTTTKPPVTSPPSSSPPAGVTSKGEVALRAPKVRPPMPPEAVTAARLLLDLIAANTPSSTLAKLSEHAKDDRAAKWADAFRLLHEKDAHSWADITAMVEWCQADPFWRSNILSGEKLREKWDQLAAKKAQPARPMRSGGGEGLEYLAQIASGERP